MYTYVLSILDFLQERTVTQNFALVHGVNKSRISNPARYFNSKVQEIHTALSSLSQGQNLETFCAAKWSSHMYTCIPSILDSLPIQVPTEHGVEFPELYSRFSLVIYFLHSSVHVSPQLLIHPSPLFPLSVHVLVLYIWVSISPLQKRSSIPFFSRFHIVVYLPYFVLQKKCMLTVKLKSLVRLSNEN